MKKSVLLMALLLLFCGCSEKKQDEDNPEVTAETEDVSDEDAAPEVPDTGDTAFGTGFRTFTDDDFKTVNVALSYPDKIPPVELTSFLIPEHDYGERLSPCKKADSPSDYFFISNDPSFEEGNFLETPEKGVPINAFLRGDKIYTVVNYDNMCYFGHEWAIYSYDTLKTKFDEVYSYSELSETYSRWYTSFMIGNKLVQTIVKDEYVDYQSSPTTIRTIDFESGEEKDVYVSEEPMSIYGNGTNKVLLFIFEEDTVLKEFDIETGEERVIAKDSDSEGEHMDMAAMSDIPAYVCRDNIEPGIKLATEYYSIETELIGVDIVYASEKRFIARQSMGRNEMHTYDLEKMEHYVTKLNGKNSLAASFDGNFVLCDLEGSQLSVDTGDIYYVVPELGVAYTLAKDSLAEMHRNGDSVEYCTIDRKEVPFGDDRAFNTYQVKGVSRISRKE